MQARLKWLKGLCRQANEKDAEKLLENMEKAEEGNEESKAAGEVMQEQEDDGVYR
jgi:pentatricopeptide repeat protein